MKKCMNAGGVRPKKSIRFAFIVHCLHCSQKLFNSEFSRHAHILVMFLLGKNDRN